MEREEVIELLESKEEKMLTRVEETFSRQLEAAVTRFEMAILQREQDISDRINGNERRIDEINRDAQQLLARTNRLFAFKDKVSDQISAAVEIAKTLKERDADYEIRMRRLEKLAYGVLGAAAILTFVLSTLK